MPTVEDLGIRVKQKYPGSYDDMDNAELGRRIKQKFPGSYDDFTDAGSAETTVGDRVLQGAQKILPVVTGEPTPTQSDRESIGRAGIGEAILQGRVGEFLSERVRLLRESPEFREQVFRGTRQNVGTAVSVGSAMLGGPLAGAARLPYAGAEAIAAMGGEAARMGITGEGDAADIVVAGALPTALRGVLRLGRGALRQARRLPGAAAGLVEEAVERGHDLIRQLRPQDLDSLRVSVRALDNMQVPLQNFRGAALALQRRAERLAPTLRPQGAMRIVQQIDDLVANSQNQALPLRQVRDNLEEVGAEIGRLRRATSDQSGLVRGATRTLQALRRVYASMLDALDNLPGNAPESLQNYRRALRTDFATNDLERIIERGVQQRAVDGMTTISARRIRDAWMNQRNSQFLQESFTVAQRAQIDEFMDEIVRLPAMPTPRGVAAGSVMAITRGGGTAGLVGGITGSPELGAAAGGAAFIAPRVISRAMMSEPGRRMLRRILADEGFISPQAISLLAAVSREATFPIAESEAAQSVPAPLFP